MIILWGVQRINFDANFGNTTMTINTLIKEIDQLGITPSLQGGLHNNTLETLYDLFIRSNAALGASATNVDNEELTIQTEDLMVAQATIIDLAAETKANTNDELLCKMALWRREAPELDLAAEEMTGADALAYSVFQDLIKLTGRLDMLTDYDIRKAA